MYVVIDQKGNELFAVAVSKEKNGSHTPKHFARCSSRGILKGVITDLREAVLSIKKVLQNLSESSGKSVDLVYMCVSSSSIKRVPSNGMILLSKYGRNVLTSDLDRCKKIAAAIKLEDDKTILHHLITNYSLDGEEYILDPMGLEGVRLTLNSEILLVDKSVVNNIEKAVALAGARFKGVIFSGIATGLRMIRKNMMSGVVAIICVYGNFTEISLYRKNKFSGCFYIKRNCLENSKNIESRKYAINRLIDDIRAIDASILHADSIVLSTEVNFTDEETELLSALLGERCIVGDCIARPFETLPNDRIGYAACLGGMDFVKSELEYPPAKNLLMNISLLCRRFLEEYL